MRVLKKFLVYALCVTFVLNIFGCGKPENDDDNGTTPEEPATTVLTPYDDKNEYSAVGYDSANYTWRDDDGVLNGKFPDGEVQKNFSEFSGESVIANTDNGETEVSYYSGKKFKFDGAIDQNLIKGEKGSYAGDTFYDIADDETIACFGIKDSSSANLTVVPNCDEEDFCNADNISFYIALSHNEGGSNQYVTVTLKDMFGAKVITLYRSKWYKIDLSINSYLNYYGGNGFKSKAEYFAALKTKPMLYFSVSSNSVQKDFKVYISKPTLTVDEVYEPESRDITDLVQTQEYNGKELPQYSMLYWTGSSTERRIDENGKTRRMFVTECSYDGGNIAIIPLKKLEQILKYDYLTVIMYIETENPYPIAVGYNGNYVVKPKQVYKMVGGDTRFGWQFVSANKWVYLKIPVKNYIDRIYGMLKNNSVYTDTSLYTRYNDGFQLFYIHGDFVNQYPNVFDAPYENKEQTYGYKLYISRMILEKVEG